MRAAKHVVKIGRKALAVATGAKSGYKDGTLPSGKTIADYHQFVCEQMYVMLNGTSGGATVAKAGSGDVDDPIDVGADGSDDEGGVGDDVGGDGHGKEDEIDPDRTSAKALDPADMPKDYMFDGMIAFFLWGHIVVDNDSGTSESYKSKQLQIGNSDAASSSAGKWGQNSRPQVKKDAAIAASKDRDLGAAVGGGSPFRRGMTLTQQLEFVKLESILSIKERRSFEQQYATALSNMQTEIENRMEFAKLLGIRDPTAKVITKIRELMQKKTELTEKFAETGGELDRKRKADDGRMEETFFSSCYQGSTAAMNLMSSRFSTAEDISMSTASLTLTTHSRPSSQSPMTSVYMLVNADSNYRSSRMTTDGNHSSNEGTAGGDEECLITPK
jgi:hypothetical protein